MGWSAGRHVDHPCGCKFRHGLLEKSLKYLPEGEAMAEILSKFERVLGGIIRSFPPTAQKLCSCRYLQSLLSHLRVTS